MRREMRTASEHSLSPLEIEETNAENQAREEAESRMRMDRVALEKAEADERYAVMLPLQRESRFEETQS